MTNRFLFLCLLSYLDNITGNPQNKSQSSLLFQDKPDLDPIGCNEQTMLTEVSGSKLSCAMSCMFIEACVLFSYVSDSKTCSLCHGDMIQNLTYNAWKTFTWAFVILENSQPSTINTFYSQSKFIPGSLSLGTIIHLCIYLFPNKQPYFSIDLKENETTGDYPLSLLVNHGQISLYSVKGSVMTNSTYVHLGSGSLLAGTTHVVDILVTAEGFRVYMDKTYCCLYRHLMPYKVAKYLWIHGYIQVMELTL
ncbi:hypothetical protein BgiBS90_034075 [Biomphalaria glabrata]|nr:hypothetical protein BgiBS90_034075 [Biomphalaria glabrata]